MQTFTGETEIGKGKQQTVNIPIAAHRWGRGKMIIARSKSNSGSRHAKAGAQCIVHNIGKYPLQQTPAQHLALLAWLVQAIYFEHANQVWSDRTSIEYQARPGRPHRYWQGSCYKTDDRPISAAIAVRCLQGLQLGKTAHLTNAVQTYFYVMQNLKT